MTAPRAFRVGDKVRLLRTVTVPRMHRDGMPHGWFHLSPTLAEGARAVVKDVAVDGSLGVVFDHELVVDPYDAFLTVPVARVGTHLFRLDAALFEHA